MFERRLWPTTVLYVPRHSSFENTPASYFSLSLASFAFVDLSEILL